jgi:hypothetical protein
MSVSTIPSFRAALLTRLQADSGLTGVQCVIGHPFPNRPSDSIVLIGDTVDGGTAGASVFGGGQTTAAMGQRRREERYVTSIVVSCIASNMAPEQTLEELAMTYAGVIETSLRTWSSGTTPWTGISLPSGAVFAWVVVQGLSLTQHFDDTQREARATLEVACAARI